MRKVFSTLLPTLLLFCFYTPSPALCGHVLVFPGEYSHWLNMRNIMEELVRRNHSVTVLVAEASPSINYNNSRDAAKFNFMVFKVTSGANRVSVRPHMTSCNFTFQSCWMTFRYLKLHVLTLNCFLATFPWYEINLSCP